MPSTSVARVTVGAALGAAGWAVLAVALPFLPDPLRFVLAWLLFTFGPGAILTARLAADLDPLRRIVFALGAGSALVPLVVDLLGRAHLLVVFPFVTAALAGAGLAWRGRAQGARADTSRGDLWSAAVLVAVAVSTGGIAFAHRLDTTGGRIVVYGDYDSMDLSYYAAMASDASHTVPPMASFYSGHQLNAAWYPQVVAAMVHRFAGVPMLSMYFRYLWPLFLALAALTAFVFVRSLAPTAVGLLAVILMLVGGDFSYLAAWFLRHDTIQWDYMLWPTNFLAPTMEVLHFNTWTPSLILLFTALFAIVRGLQTRRAGWTLVSAVVIGVLFQFKPFAFLVLLPALVAAAVLAPRIDRVSLTHFGATVALSALCALPFAYGAATQPDRRSRFLVDLFLLPQRMLLKLDLIDPFNRVAARLAPGPAFVRPLYLLLATMLFLAVGPGVRWLGAGGVWRAIRSQDEGPDAVAWRLLAWVVIIGAMLPFVLVTDPYVDTLQFYQTALYVMWIFAALALVAIARRRRAAGWAAVALAVAVTLPSSVHFLAMKWHERERPPRVTLTAGEVEVARYLKDTDPEKTVLLHDRPQDPSLLSIVADRRVVLAWGHPYYAAASEGRLREVNAFFASAGGDAGAALETLRRYGVTHVVVHGDRDRVHPDVLARLRLIVQASDQVALYAVTGV